MKSKIVEFLFFGGLALSAIGWFLPGKVIPSHDHFSGAEVINGVTIIGGLMCGSALLLAIISAGGSPRKYKKGEKRLHHSTASCFTLRIGWLKNPIDDPDVQAGNEADLGIPLDEPTPFARRLIAKRSAL